MSDTKLVAELKNAAEWYALTEPETAELLQRAAEVIEKATLGAEDDVRLE